jgi:uncharacterized protein (TIGR03000 family)
MFKLNLWTGAGAALISAILLLTPATSEAQWRGARRGGEQWGRGGYTAPRSYGYVWSYGNPGYYYSGNYYPRYEAGVYVTPDFSTTPQAYQSNYFDDPAYQSPSNPNSAGFLVRVPDPNAEVWFNNHRTQQRGNVRQFTSGSLDPNHDYTFQVRARWTDNSGQQVDQSRDVTFRAGQQISVDFAAPGRERILTNPGD